MTIFQILASRTMRLGTGGARPIRRVAAPETASVSGGSARPVVLAGPVGLAGPEVRTAFPATVCPVPYGAVARTVAIDFAGRTIRPGRRDEV